MLTGKIVYKDNIFGSTELDVYARATMSDLKLYFPYSEEEQEDITNRKINLYNGNTNSDYISPAVTDYWRRIDVSFTNKYKSNIQNSDMCLRLAGLLRYMQVSGSRRGKQKENVIALGVEPEFCAKKRVLIDGIGFIDFDYGVISGLEAHSPYFDITLCDKDITVPDFKYFGDFKKKDKYGNVLVKDDINQVGFKLSSDILGFEYKPVFKKSSDATLTELGMYTNIDDVIADNPGKNTVWIKGREYYIVTDENIDAVCADFYAYAKTGGYIAYDTETSGLDITFKSRTGEADFCCGLSLSKEEGTGYYFPLQHRRFKNLCDGDHYYVMERYIKPILETGNIICHNLIFDYKVAYIYEIVPNIVFDTMLAFGVTKRYEVENYDLGLKALCAILLGLDMFDLEDFVKTDWASSGVIFADLPYELVRQYAPADADITYTLWKFIKKTQLLENYGAKRVFDLEVNFAKVVAISEFYGYHIDIDRIEELKSRIEHGMEKEQGKMFKLAGHEFNPNSPVQLSSVMYDELNIPPVNKSRSTAKGVLKELAEYETIEGEPLYPFVTHLKSYRDYEGIHKNFLKRLHEFVTDDGFIFPDVMQLGTNTGRCSVKNPNYQSYNDVVKQYVTPRPNYLLFDCDFAQIEYRILASMAQQDDLIKRFDDPDLDYHTYQASRMFSIPYASVTKTLRQQSKGINFGLPYGMGDSSLGARIFGKRTKENTMKAAGLRKKFFQGQEKIQEFFEVVRANGVKNGYTETYLGRRRYYFRGKFTEAEIRRQAGNHVIQGTAADVYKIAVCRLFNEVCKRDWLGLVLFDAFIHDEALLEVHKSINMFEFFKVWKQTYEVSIKGFAKLFAGAGVGHSWYEAKKQDLPPQYIEEIIATYSPDMSWDEDINGFVDKVKINYEQYKRKRVYDYILDAENQGNIIKPVINSLLGEVVVVDFKKIFEAKMALDLRDKLKGVHPEAFEADGSLKLSKKNRWEPKFSTQELLDLFCYQNNLERSSINILSPDAGKAQSDDDVPVQQVNYVETSQEEQLYNLVVETGYMFDVNERRFYVLFDPTQTEFLSMLKNTYCKTEGQYALVFVRLVNNKPELLGTKYFVDSMGVYNLQTYFAMIHNR